MADAVHSDFWRSLPKWFTLVKQWFIGEDLVRARLFGLAAVGLSLTTTVLLVQVSYAQRAFINALSEKDVDGFYSALWRFLRIIIAAVFISTLNPYVESHLELAWRTHMTKFLCKAFFNSHTHYRVVHTEGIDNPDQRISQDVNNFVITSTKLILKLTSTVFSTVAFGGVLWSISRNLVGVIIVYTSIGTWLTASVFGRRLMSLKFSALKQEADMRFALVRVREYSESISFYSGQAAEAASVDGRFSMLISTVSKAINLNALLNAWRNVYDYATILVPPVVIAPSYFAGEIQFGVVTQADYAFAKIVGAFSLIILQLESISGLAAETDRLYELYEALRVLSPENFGPAGGMSDSKRTCLEANWILQCFGRGTKVKVTEDDTLPLTTPESSQHTPVGGQEGQSSILRTVLEDEHALLAVRGLHARVPVPDTVSRQNVKHDAYVVADDLSFSVEAGDSLLIMGPSGCGKSSLLRVMAGLWTQGSGSIQCAAQQDCFFLPQKAYMPLGSLRQQLIFPQYEDGQQVVESDAVLRRLAAEARLPKLAAPEVDLNATGSWAEVFSVGEQQRIAFARLLRMRPKLAFLDEATSALDVDTEREMYQLLNASCQGFVSVGHRPQLLSFHTHVLRWEAPGKWSLSRST